MKQRTKIRKLKKTLAKVKKYQDQFEKFTDNQLKGLTPFFKEKLAEGDTLEDILPMAFAAICEVCYRVLGKFPYDTQIMGAIALNGGYLAQMNTGEGKTLVATMPLYLNALTGKSTILVTTNEYLALRDAQEMGPVYEFMGLTVAAGVTEKPDMKLTNEEKKEIYSADIVYTTHSVLGFDYLLNNLVTNANDRFMREFFYVIIDEADSVLLDSAQTPLVISGSPRVQSNLYELADFFVTTLEEGRDYETEDKKVWLTDEGVKYAETFFEIDNFYGKEFFEINRHVILALRAHVIFEKEREYMVSNDGKLNLLDSGSGRMMPGVKLRGGMHQALEIKEKLEISQENRSVASITYQNLFLLFPKMSGMSGTISDASYELLEVYKVRVLVIPPHKKVKRKDYRDYYYKDKATQFSKAIDLAVKTHKSKQPVLIVVSTIGETELVSRFLIDEKIPHNVLNANNAFWEADIIKEAGQKGAVTVATSMAGRGTDIKLGEGVKKLGGLAVIGIGRMANIRQERQARGRSGRQGDPGFSRFFVALEDEVVRENGPQKVQKLAKKKHRVFRFKLKRIINNSQKLSEEFAVSARKKAMDYDQVLQRQRQVIYATRDSLLDGEEFDIEKIYAIAENNINRFLDSHSKLDAFELRRYVLDNISYRLDERVENIDFNNKKIVVDYLMNRVKEGIKEQEYKLGSRDRLDNFMRAATLTAIDDAWVEEVDYLQQLQSAVLGRTSAQRNVVYEYHKDALESFKAMEITIHTNIVRNILLSNVYVDNKFKLHIIFP